MTMTEGGGKPRPVKQILQEDWDNIVKVLTWVHDNPGIHPENIRYELKKLYNLHVKV